MGDIPIERCPTGIPGFDKLCQGGLVRNSINTLLGGPGAGKTTFLLQYLWNGVKMFNENGLYLSFEPEVFDIFQDAMALGWDFTKLDAKGDCKFIKMSPQTNIRSLKAELAQLVSKHDVRRICIDPVSILTMKLEKESSVREVLFDLTSMLKRLKVTVLLAEENLEGSMEDSSLGALDTRSFIKFLTDSLINLHSVGIGGEADRAVRIVKMRRTAHVREPVPMQLTNQGIVVKK